MHLIQAWDPPVARLKLRQQTLGILRSPLVDDCVIPWLFLCTAGILSLNLLSASPVLYVLKDLQIHMENTAYKAKKTV